MNRRSRSARFARTLTGLAALAAVLAFSVAAQAQPQATETQSAVCGGVAQGAPWTYKGQKGTAYSVVGVNGVPCATGIKFMPKWTRDRATFDLTPVPAGWHCSAIGDYSGLAKLGQCTTKQGGIFEWLPKRK
jgi:hypothetical protein